MAPFLPSARSSAARSFIAARSAALKPSDSVVAFFVGMSGLPSVQWVSVLPASSERLGARSAVLLDS